MELKKYLYNVGYYTHEESQYDQLSHTKKYTKEEFEKFVLEIILDVLRSRDDKESNFSYQRIHSEVIEKLVERYGFKEVEFEADFNIFGWANLLDEEDWKHDQDENLMKIRDAISKYKNIQKIS